MKKILIPVFSVFMVMAILVNTAGITVYSHFCHSEGKSSIFLSKDENCCKDEKKKIEEKHGCCKKEEKSTSKKKNCCSQDEFSAQWQLTEFSVFKNIIITSFALSEPFHFSFQNNFCQSYFISTANYSPPFLESSSDLLIQHSVFRI